MLKGWFHESVLAFRQEFYGAGRFNKTLLFLLVLLPLVYTLLFGAAYSANVLNHIPVVVCDLEQSSISRTLTLNYDTSDRFRVVKQVSSYEEMQAALKNGEAKVGLYVPSGVDRNLRTASPAEVGVYIEASNMVYGSAALVASEEINLNLLVGGSQKILEHMTIYPDRALRMAYPATMSVRILNNPTNSYCNFMLLGLVCNGIQISLFLYAVDMFVKNKAQKWRYKTALLWGKLCAVELVSVAVFSICLLISQYVFAVPLRAPWYEFLFLEAVFVFFFTGLGMFLSIIFNAHYARFIVQRSELAAGMARAASRHYTGYFPDYLSGSADAGLVAGRCIESFGRGYRYHGSSRYHSYDSYFLPCEVS